MRRARWGNGMTPTKLCTKCQRDLPVTAFAFNRTKLDRLQTSCRECKKAQQGSWYRRNRERHIENVRPSRAAAVERNLRYVVHYLLDNPCLDCGENDPLILQFDHVRGEKVACVSELVSRGSAVTQIQLEIEKC